MFEKELEEKQHIKVVASDEPHIERDFEMLLKHAKALAAYVSDQEALKSWNLYVESLEPADAN